MRAAVYRGDQRVEVEEVPRPSPGPDDVLIEVSHCGICGTDLHFVVEGWGTPGSINGHEYSGVIVETGSGVTDWKVGDRVVGGPGQGCGSCAPCLAGHDHLCEHRDKPGVTPFQGAFADYKLIRAGHVFGIPDSLDLRSAALTEPVAVALRGVRRSQAGPGSRVLVTGGGPIGQLSVAVLRALGVSDITVSEPSPRRQELARRLGAFVVAPSDLVDPGLPMDRVAEPYDVAIECSGRPDATTAALSQLGRSGVLVLSGTGMDRPRLDTLRVILNELVVTGTYEYSRDDYDSAIRLLAGGELPVADLIEAEDVGLAEVGTAMQRLSGGELAGKVMVSPRG
jgi:2-desacetyl-2-hydroxyethyl bacteriochlorophyllide A dehydrogenase